MQETFLEDGQLAGLESDFKHLDNFCDGFESIVSQYRDKGYHGLQGCESYTIGVLKASGMNWQVQTGVENFITDGLAKLWKMIKSVCNSIYEFFFGSKDSTLKDEHDLIKDLDKVVTAGKGGTLLLTNQEIAEVVKEAVAKASAAPVTSPIPSYYNPVAKPMSPSEGMKDLKEQVKAEYAKAATEAVQSVKSKNPSMTPNEVKVQVTAEVTEAIAKVTEEEVIKKTVRELSSELNTRLQNHAEFKKYEKRVRPALDTLLMYGRMQDDSRDGVLVSSQFCMPGGSVWFQFDDNLKKKSLSVKWFIEFEVDAMEGWVQRYTRELEAAEGKWKNSGPTPEEQMKILNNSRKCLQALAEVAAVTKTAAKKIRKIYAGLAIDFEAMKAKRIRIALARME